MSNNKDKKEYYNGLRHISEILSSLIENKLIPDKKKNDKTNKELNNK